MKNRFNFVVSNRDFQQVFDFSGAPEARRSQPLRHINQWLIGHSKILLDGSLDELLDAKLDVFREIESRKLNHN